MNKVISMEIIWFTYVLVKFFSMKESYAKFVLDRLLF